MVHPDTHGVSRAPWYSGALLGSHLIFRLLGCHLLWRSVPGPSARLVLCNFPARPQSNHTTSRNPELATPAGYHAGSVWAVPLSLAATDGIAFAFSSWGY